MDTGRPPDDTTTKPRYSLDDLVAQCDDSVEISTELREWLDSPPVGGELL